MKDKNKYNFFDEFDENIGKDMINIIIVLNILTMMEFINIIKES